MAYTTTKIGRAWLRQQSDWGYSNIDAIVAFVAADLIESEVFVPPLVAEVLETEAFRAHWHAHRKQGGSKKGVSIDVTMPATGWTTTAPGSIASDPTSSPFSLLLASALGSDQALGFSAADVTGGSTTTVEYTEGLSPDCEGYAIAVADGTEYSIGWVIDRTLVGASPDVLTVANSFQSGVTVPDGGLSWGGRVLALSTATDIAPLNMLWTSAIGAQVRFYDGAVTSATLTMTPAGQPMLAASIQFGGWEVEGSLASAPVQLAYTLPQIPAALGRNGARAVVNSVATQIANLEISIENTLVEAGDFAGREGIAKYVTGDRVVTVTWTDQEPDYTDLWEPGEEFGPVQIDLATTPGNALSVYFETAHVMESEALADADGVIASTLTIQPGISDDDQSTVAPANSPFRIAVL